MENNSETRFAGWRHVKICITDGVLSCDDCLIDAEDSETETIPLGVFVKDPITGEPWAVDAFRFIPRKDDTIVCGEVVLKVKNVWHWGASAEIENEVSRCEALVECTCSEKSGFNASKDAKDKARKDYLNSLLDD